jgi:hypothetical protein
VFRSRAIPTRIARRDLQVDSIDLEAILDYGESLLNVASMWTEARFEQKQRIQRVLLPSGVPYADGAFGNSEIIRATYASFRARMYVW